VNVAVCIKQVPSTETRIRINTQTNFVDTSEIDWVINPFDEYALELGLRARERFGGAITVVGLGPERIRVALRTALAMGADSAIQLTDTGFEQLDSLATGRALAAALRREPTDVVLCGKQAVDDDQAAVPAAVAHFLGLPHVALVAEVEFGTDGTLVARREVEGATEVVTAPLPCLLTVGKAKVEPRLPSLKGMMAAKKKEIPVLDRAALGLEPGLLVRRVEYLEDRLPPGRKAGRVLEGEPGQVVPELVRLLREEAKVV
jgi:electron transfer flavoprotein beta subunit